MSTEAECTETERSWKITVSKEADKKIRSLDKTTRNRMDERLSQMQVNPYPVVKPLQGWDNLWSSRVGGWRIICTIADDVKVVAVVWVASRGQVYDDIAARF